MSITRVDEASMSPEVIDVKLEDVRHKIAFRKECRFDSGQGHQGIRGGKTSINAGTSPRSGVKIIAGRCGTYQH
jgi:hypothetical protein